MVPMVKIDLKSQVHMSSSLAIDEASVNLYTGGSSRYVVEIQKKNCLGRSANCVVFEKCEIVPCMLRPRHVLAKFMLRWWCSH